MGTESGIPFGNYTLIKRIARGGMAEVFVARQLGMDGFDRMVAIKRILPHLLDDKSFVRMFQEEAKLAARLSHPNVIHIYDFGKVSEHFFIAMEFMHGVHAGELIRLAGEAPIPVPLIARIGADACAGLHYAHNRQDERGQALRLVHRDVSPPNLLVSFDGVVKIVDFGIAKAVSSIEQTRPGVVKGKYAYMSPEQTMGKKLDGRSDVFSLALVLWELLAGKPAVTRSDQILAMKTIRDGKVLPVESVREDVPQALAEAMRGALHKDPSQRSDARVFGNALESFIKSSNEIATSMELGAWLAGRVPRQELSGGTSSGTRQATMATKMASAEASLDDLLFEEPRRPDAGTRGSVVANISDENQETRVLSIASGDLKTEQSSQIRPMSTAGNSVVIDSGLISDVPEAREQTATRRVLSEAGADTHLPTAAVSSLSDFDSEEDTYMQPPPAPSAERTQTLEGPVGAATFTGQTEAPTTEAGEAPFPAFQPGPSALGPGPAQRHLGPHVPASGPELAFAPSYPPPAPMRRGGRVGLLAIGALLLLAAGGLALLLSGGEEKPKASVPQAPVPADAAPTALLTPLDARAPQIVVTPLLDADLPENNAVLEITTRPKGARITLNEVERGLSPRTFADLPAGEIRIEIQLDGYLPQRRSINLRANQHRSVELALEKEKKAIEPKGDPPPDSRPPKQKNGRLVVRTSPYSTVYHRGKKLGVTPMANVQLKPGRYKLSFKNPKHRTVTRTITIRPGKTTKLDFEID